MEIMSNPFLKFSKASQNKTRLDAMVNLAKHMLSVHANDLDSDPWLLNCANGVVDLKTGKFLSPDRGYFMTKNCHVNFGSNANCTKWREFLNDITGEDPELIDFLQKAVGYSLTGEISEHCLFILYGTGLNGKSTFIETIMALLGDYAKKAEMRSFLNRNNDGANNDIAGLCGSRFVSAVEIGRGKSLNEALIKELTGGDSITARFLFNEFFTYIPQFKILLGVNAKPEIHGLDEGIWRRIRLIPFEVKIPKEKVDKNLPKKLRGELPGILNWAIEGCLKWQKEGLGEPSKVMNATSDYRDEMDVLSQFFDERCVLSSETVGDTDKPIVSVDQLFTAFLDWSQKNGADKVTKKAFGALMGERGFKSQPKYYDGKNRRVYEGVGMKS
jgi:putative DNA primase/helicase